MENRNIVMRIKILIEKNGGNPAKFSKIIGYNQSNLSKILRGERDVPANLINTICEKLNVRYNWLVLDDGEMLNGEVVQSGTENVQNIGNSANTHNDNRRYYEGCGGADEKAAGDILDLQRRMSMQEESEAIISCTHGKPYYNVDFIGGFDVILNDQTVNPDYLINFKKYDDADYWCNITGHSMEPLISNGDIIAIKEMKGWRDFILYGEVYGIITEEMRTVKVVTKSERGDDFLCLVPVNNSMEYKPQDIPIRLITHVFKVLGCMKRL